MIPPQLLAGVVEKVRRGLTADQIRELAGLSREDLSGCHFGLARQIRNEWIYPDAAMMAAHHENKTSADDVSALVVGELWNALGQ